MTQRKLFIFLLYFVFLSSCAATDNKRAELNYDKNASHATHHTLNYKFRWVDEATLLVLDQMDIMIIDNNSSPAGNSIKAATIDSNIMIELKSLTPNSTLMKINVQYPDSQITKSATNEIFNQTRQLLLSNKHLNKSGLEEPIESTKKFIPTE